MKNSEAFIASEIHDSGVNSQIEQGRIWREFFNLCGSAGNSQIGYAATSDSRSECRRSAERKNKFLTL